MEEFEVTFKEYRLALEADTSSSKAERLRFCRESSIFGSMFSLSEPISGEGARRLSDGTELGVIAEAYVSKLTLSQTRLSAYHSVCSSSSVSFEPWCR